MPKSSFIGSFYATGYLRVNQFDAIIMDLNSLEPKDLENLPKRRNPGARYLAYFESLEFPEFINKLQFLFNWTMGPTLESDLFTQPASMQQNQKVYIFCLTSFKSIDLHMIVRKVIFLNLQNYLRAIASFR